MNSIEATIRSTKTKGELNTLRKKGEVPGIIYGGRKSQNQKVSVSTKALRIPILSNRLRCGKLW